MNKKEAIDEIIKQEEKYIVRLEESYEQYRMASDLDEESTMDRQEMSHANEAKDMQLRLKIQLDKSKADLEELKSTSAGSYETVQSGSLVGTENKIFYMGISIHALEIKGRDVLGVSADSPAYKTMYGLKKGDRFKLGKNDYTIIAIE